MAGDLKPCPFCGGEPDENDVGGIYCQACWVTNGGGWDPTPEDWNTRAPLASDEELRALQMASASVHLAAANQRIQSATESATGIRVGDAHILYAQRTAATLSALERRLRGVPE